ncbi:MAG: DUF1365 domain-containing protein [Gammaproteobacteria bacterium]
MKSCIYVGRVRHRRRRPVSHVFSYRLFMVYLDLDELPDVFRPYWLWSAQRPALAWFRRRDYLGDGQQPLPEAVRDVVEQRTGERPCGPIRLLTHLRYFGYGFNPVSFYYCFDDTDNQVQAIVAEVSNTPWNERHCYVLSEPVGTRDGTLRYRFPKAFHVSPFMAMDMTYDWRFTEPAERLIVHMNTLQEEIKLFDATLTLQRRPLTSRNLAQVLLSYPAMTAKVVVAIYVQAFRLWIKRCPFYVHPKKQPSLEAPS